MAEYIDKGTAIAKLTALEVTEPNATMTSAKRLLADVPAADVAPVVHGRWISFLDGDHIMPERYYRCSRCGRVESRQQPYCHCGAKMDGGDGDAAD